MLTWLNKGGAETSKITLRQYRKNYRGIHALEDIKEKETIMFIPNNYIMTLEDVS